MYSFLLHHQTAAFPWKSLSVLCFIFSLIRPRVLNLLCLPMLQRWRLRRSVSEKELTRDRMSAKGLVTGNHTILFRSHSCRSVWFIGKYSLFSLLSPRVSLLSLLAFPFLVFPLLPPYFLLPFYSLSNRFYQRLLYSTRWKILPTTEARREAHPSRERERRGEGVGRDSGAPEALCCHACGMRRTE